MNDFNIDMGSAVPFLWDKFLSFVGKDRDTQELQKWFSALQGAAIAEASTVQCIGMDHPLPIGEIYQPTKLIWQSLFLFIPATSVRASQKLDLSRDCVSPQQFLATPTSAIIRAGPGWGKTTFLHYLFMQLLHAPDYLPVLFTLRRPEALNNLFLFVDSLDKVQKLAKRPQLLLVVDGYDEIATAERKRVSDTLLECGPRTILLNV